MTIASFRDGHMNQLALTVPYRAEYNSHLLTHLDLASPDYFPSREIIRAALSLVGSGFADEKFSVPVMHLQGRCER